MRIRQNRLSAWDRFDRRTTANDHRQAWQAQVAGSMLQTHIPILCFEQGHDFGDVFMASCL